MLQITVPAVELWDEEKLEFINLDEQLLELEHSLVSISKWESKWHKSYISSPNKTDEEVLDYIKCMTLTPNVKPEVYYALSKANIQMIVDYINDPMTATTFTDDKTSRPSREIITSEIIYEWMIALNIPHEFQEWHINRLLALIKVRSIKTTPPKKRSRRDILSRNAAINAARRQQLNTKG